jgi:hypothetical protein
MLRNFWLTTADSGIGGKHHQELFRTSKMAELILDFPGALDEHVTKSTFAGFPRQGSWDDPVRAFVLNAGAVQLPRLIN